MTTLLYNLIRQHLLKCSGFESKKEKEFGVRKNIS
jgi:hypothetical protein